MGNDWKKTISKSMQIFLPVLCVAVLAYIENPTMGYVGLGVAIASGLAKAGIDYYKHKDA